MTYKLIEDKLVEQSPTIESSYQWRATHEVEKTLRKVDHLKSLHQRDQSLEDVDDRPLHLVLPDDRYESHPESGFRYDGEVRIVGNEESFEARMEGSGDRRNQVIHWRKEDNLVTHEFDQELPPPMPPKEKTSEFQFELSGKENISLPSARSLEEAERIKERREVAIRSQEMLEVAKHFQTLHELFDDGEFDKDQAPGRVLIKGRRLGGELSSSSIVQSLESYGRRTHYQSDATVFRVEGPRDQPTAHPPIALRGHFKPDSGWAELEDEEIRESITWNDGKLVYTRFDVPYDD